MSKLICKFNVLNPKWKFLESFKKVIYIFYYLEDELEKNNKCIFKKSIKGYLYCQIWNYKDMIIKIVFTYRRIDWWIKKLRHKHINILQVMEIFPTVKKMMEIYCFKKTIWWDIVLQFLVATVTNYNKLGDLELQKFILFQIWRPGVRNQFPWVKTEMSTGSFLWRPLQVLLAAGFPWLVAASLQPLPAFLYSFSLC